jgi:hypothetical protein
MACAYPAKMRTASGRGCPTPSFARSFASVYVLVVWIRCAYDEDLVRAEIQRALPQVEALTVSLPPPKTRLALLTVGPARIWAASAPSKSAASTGAPFLDRWRDRGKGRKPR